MGKQPKVVPGEADNVGRGLAHVHEVDVARDARLCESLPKNVQMSTDEGGQRGIGQSGRGPVEERDEVNVRRRPHTVSLDEAAVLPLEAGDVAPPPVSTSDSTLSLAVSSQLPPFPSAERTEPVNATRAVPSSSGVSARGHLPASTPSMSSAQAGTERDARLAEELTLVQTARTALVRGDASGALEAAETHRQRFPAGRLVEERESVAIQALVRLGRGEEARGRAADFERKYPTSILLPAIGRALRSIK